MVMDVMYMTKMNYGVPSLTAMQEIWDQQLNIAVIVLMVELEV